MRNDLRLRHDEDARRRAASLFGEGWGQGPVAHRLGIPLEAVRNWLYTYRAVGLEGFLSMGSKHAKYTFEQKVAAARAVVDEGRPRPEVMAGLGIASLTPLKNWCKAYREGGEDALGPKAKGRPKGSAANPKPPKTREQGLEERIRKLEAENAYLKKLEALRAEEALRTGPRPRW